MSEKKDNGNRQMTDNGTGSRKFTETPAKLPATQPVPQPPPPEKKSR